MTLPLPENLLDVGLERLGGASGDKRHLRREDEAVVESSMFWHGYARTIHDAAPLAI